jgi:hypothetical protein
MTIPRPLAVTIYSSINRVRDQPRARACRLVQRPHRGHRRVAHAAGHDAGEVAQVRVDVQGDAVEGDPTTAAHADGGDLAPVHPHADAAPAARSLDAEIGQGADHHLLQPPDMPVQVLLGADVGDDVADELARPVVGHLAAAAAGEDGDGLAVDDAGQDIGLATRGADGVDGRMLGQDQDRGVVPGQHAGHAGLLLGQ